MLSRWIQYQRAWGVRGPSFLAYSRAWKGDGPLGAPLGRSGLLVGVMCCATFYPHRALFTANKLHVLTGPATAAVTGKSAWPTPVSMARMFQGRGWFLSPRPRCMFVPLPLLFKRASLHITTRNENPASPAPLR